MGLESVSIQEWQEKFFEGLFLHNDYERNMAASITQSGLIEIIELRTGLLLKTKSYVGRINLGGLQITVYPKMAGSLLLNLLRYAYKLRNLKLSSAAEFSIESSNLHDILAYQLMEEVKELLLRGLHRRYVNKREDLFNPRGKIDFKQLAGSWGYSSVSLPCHYYPRQDNCLQNQVLLAGLLMCVRLVEDVALKSDLRNVIRLFNKSIETISLNHDLMNRLDRETDRLTQSYKPSFTIIKILLNLEGLVFEEADKKVKVPGFMFDMNRFFQAVLSRFLKDNLKEFEVHEEFSLKGMMSYNPGYNPKRRRAPRVRPDFVVYNNDRKIISILDAKYRDLWENELTRDMLYQLTIYALSKQLRESVILYPTVYDSAGEARIDITDPVNSNYQAKVILRPVNLYRLNDLIQGEGYRGEKNRHDFARSLVGHGNCVQ